VKNRLFAKVIRSAMVGCFALGSCLIVSTGCQENGKACPSTCKQTCAKPCPKKCSTADAKKKSQPKHAETAKTSDKR